MNDTLDPSEGPDPDVSGTTLGDHLPKTGDDSGRSMIAYVAVLVLFGAVIMFLAITFLLACCVSACRRKRRRVSGVNSECKN